MIAARTDAALMARIQPVLETFHATMKSIWIGALLDAGYDRKDAELILRMTLNMIRGMAMNNIWESDVSEYKRLIETWCQWEREKRASKRP